MRLLHLLRNALLRIPFVNRIVYFLIKLVGQQNVVSFLDRKFLSSVALFHRDGGDMSVLNNLEISQIDRVLILGGYTGESTDRFLSAADCTIVVLEPVQEYFHLLEKRFQDERRLRFFNYGVANADRSVNIYVNGQTTSAFEEFGTPQLVQLRDISNVLEEIGGVDILEINIEGGEYDVLERLIEVDLLREIRILLIQFHTTVEGHESRRANIRDHLRKSHTETFNYEYVWERWDLSI